MYAPTPFRDRSRPTQIVLGGVVPAVFGAAAGILIGVSTGAYWALSAIAAIGSIIAGFEHRDGWGGADRGLTAGAIYGAALLVAHTIAGTQAKVSLGKLPPLLVVITALAGMLLCATGGRIARLRREHSAVPADKHISD